MIILLIHGIFQLILVMISWNLSILLLMFIIMDNSIWGCNRKIIFSVVLVLIQYNSIRVFVDFNLVVLL